MLARSSCLLPQGLSLIGLIGLSRTRPELVLLDSTSSAACIGSAGAFLNRDLESTVSENGAAACSLGVEQASSSHTDAASMPDSRRGTGSATHGLNVGHSETHRNWHSMPMFSSRAMTTSTAPSNQQDDFEPALDRVMAASHLGEVIEAKINSCAILTQLVSVLDLHEHEMKEGALIAALDSVLRNLKTMRGHDNTLFRNTIRRLGQVFMREMPHFEAIRCVRILHSFGVLRVNPAGTEHRLKEVNRHVREHVYPHLQTPEQIPVLVDLLWGLAGISARELPVDEELFRLAQAPIKDALTVLPLKSLSKLAHAYDWAGVESFGLMEAVAQTIYQKCRNPAAGEPINYLAFAQALKSLAARQCWYEALGGLATQLVQKRQPGLLPRHIITIAKSLAMMKYDTAPEPFWTSARGAVLGSVQVLTPQQLQDVAWTWTVRKQFQDVELFNAISIRSLEVLKDFTPINLAIMVWAFAKQGRTQDVTLYKAASLHMRAHLNLYTTQNISNAVWGFAGVGFKDLPLLTEAANLITQRLQDEEGRPSLTVDSSAHEERWLLLKGNCSVTRTRLGVKFIERHEYGSGNLVEREYDSLPLTYHYVHQNIGDLAWAFAHQGVVPAPLFQVLASRSLKIMHQFSQTTVVDVAWGFQKAGYKSPELFAALEKHVVEPPLVLLSHFNADYLSELVYSMAMVGHQPHDDFLKLALSTAQQRWHVLQTAEKESTVYRLISSLFILKAHEVQPDHPISKLILGMIAAEEQKSKEEQRPTAQDQGENRINRDEDHDGVIPS